MKIIWLLQNTGQSIAELLAAFVRRRQRRLLLVLPLLLLVGLLLALVSSSGVLAPFLYPLL